MTNSLQAYYNSVIDHGYKSTPRGMGVTALMNQTFSCRPGDAFKRPGGNLSIGFIEMLQFISGTFSIEPFKVIAPNARLDLFTPQSAYGPRVVNQVDRVIEELTRDVDTRRAVMTIMHATDTNETMPCTINAQFQVERNRYGDKALSLIAVWTMRSSDLIWGLPTDLIQFGGFTQMIANCVGAIPEELIVNAGNAHVYDSTRMKPGEQFEHLGEFAIPFFYNCSSYVSWANVALECITSKALTVNQLFPIIKENENETNIPRSKQEQQVEVKPD